MGWLDRLFAGSKRNDNEDTDDGQTAAAPEPVTRGTVLQFDGARGLITTADAQVLSFEHADCLDFVPKDRQPVSIQSVEGMSARGVRSLGEPATAEELRANERAEMQAQRERRAPSARPTASAPSSCVQRSCATPTSKR